MGDLWVKTIHHSLLIALGASMAETARSKGGDREAGLTAARATIEQSLAGISITGTSASGKTADLQPELQRRMKPLLDEAEKHARKSLGLSEARQVH